MWCGSQFIAACTFGSKTLRKKVIRLYWEKTGHMRKHLFFVLFFSSAIVLADSELKYDLLSITTITYDC